MILHACVHKRREDFFPGGRALVYFSKRFSSGVLKVAKFVFLPLETKKTTFFAEIFEFLPPSDTRACVQSPWEGASRYYVPGPGSYGGVRHWRKIWVYFTKKQVILQRNILVIKLVWPKGFCKLVWYILMWIAGGAFSWCDALIIISSNYFCWSLMFAYLFKTFKIFTITVPVCPMNWIFLCVFHF